MNRWLADAGFLRQRPLWTLRRKVIRKVLPRSWRSRLDVIDHILVHRPRSRAWADTLEPGTAAVWIHVAGRYPYGCVGPGAEYEAVRTEIVTGLQALCGPEGDPVFQAVHRREELYHGGYVAEAPDVIAKALRFAPDSRGGLITTIDNPTVIAALNAQLESTQRPAKNAEILLQGGAEKGLAGQK